LLKPKQILFYLLLCVSTIYAQNTPSQLFIASGSRGGNYYNTGKFIAGQYNKFIPNHRFSVVETGGSIDNIDMLRNNKVDLAIIQRNVLLKNIYDDDKGTKNLLVLAPLFQEKLLVYQREKQNLNLSKLDSLLNIKSLKVGVSGKGGYSYKIFKTVLTYLDIDQSKLNIVELNYRDLMDSLKNGKLDLLVSFSLPLKELEQQKNIHKMFLGEKEAEILQNRLLNVQKTSLSGKKGEYSLGTWSFLVGARKSVENIQPESLLTTALLNPPVNKEYEYVNQLIQKSIQAFASNRYQEKHQLKNLPLSAGLTGKINLHSIRWKPYQIVFSVLFLLILLNYFTRGKYLPKLPFLYFWHRYKHFQIGFILLIFIYFASIELLIYSERLFYQNVGIKSQILNLTRSDLHSWLFVTTVTGNSNGIFPLSLMGKIMLALNSLNFWIGTILIGMSEYVTYKINKKRKAGLMETKNKDHVVIFGWNRNTADFIQGVLHDAEHYYNKKIRIVSVVQDVEEVREKYPEIKELHDRKTIDIIKGDAIDRVTLEKARVHLANTVILLSDNQAELADERTVMRAFSLSKFVRKKANNGELYKITAFEKTKNKITNWLTKGKPAKKKYTTFDVETTADRIYLIAELYNEDYVDTLVEADVNEILIAGNYRKAVMKQSIFNHGISKVINEIVNFNEENEFYKIDLSESGNEHLVGKTFDELLILLRKVGILLIGVHIIFHDNKTDSIIIDKDKIKALLAENENGITRDIIVNPIDEKERLRPVDDDDHLIVLARNMKEVRAAVKRLKTMD